MRFLCFGVGAIGTYIGGSLALAGHRVVFVERPNVAQDVRERGLALERADGKHRVDKPEVVESVEAALRSKGIQFVEGGVVYEGGRKLE